MAESRSLVLTVPPLCMYCQAHQSKKCELFFYPYRILCSYKNALCNPEQPHEDVEDEEMSGIEGIEKVFGDWALNEAATAVVEVNGYKGQSGYPAII